MSVLFSDASIQVDLLIVPYYNQYYEITAAIDQNKQTNKQTKIFRWSVSTGTHLHDLTCLTGIEHYGYPSCHMNQVDLVSL